jgi:dsRNA-specific ribonuclease
MKGCSSKEMSGDRCLGCGCVLCRNVNIVSVLHSYCQSNRLEYPTYAIEATGSTNSRQAFKGTTKFKNPETDEEFPVEGMGGNKKEVQRVLAQQILQKVFPDKVRR